MEEADLIQHHKSRVMVLEGGTQALYERWTCREVDLSKGLAQQSIGHKAAGTGPSEDVSPTPGQAVDVAVESHWCPWLQWVACF